MVTMSVVTNRRIPLTRSFPIKFSYEIFSLKNLQDKFSFFWDWDLRKLNKQRQVREWLLWTVDKARAKGNTCRYDNRRKRLWKQRSTKWIRPKRVCKQCNTKWIWNTNMCVCVCQNLCVILTTALASRRVKKALVLDISDRIIHWSYLLYL